MPNVPPGAKVGAPGTVTNENAYPQWAVGGGSPGASSGWQIVEVSNASQKETYVAKGYIFFSTKQAAQSYLTGEENPYTSGNPTNWLSSNFSALIERGGEILVGAILLYIGLKAALTPAGQSPAGQTVKKTAKRALEFLK